MRAYWWRWRHRRQFAALLQGDEQIREIEAAGSQGWCLTDAALYVIGYSEEPTRLPLDQIRSVEEGPTPLVVIVRSRSGEALPIAVKRRSKLLGLLGHPER